MFSFILFYFLQEFYELRHRYREMLGWRESQRGGRDGGREGGVLSTGNKVSWHHCPPLARHPSPPPSFLCPPCQSLLSSLACLWCSGDALVTLTATFSSVPLGAPSLSHRPLRLALSSLLIGSATTLCVFGLFLVHFYTVVFAEESISCDWPEC